MTRSRGVLTDGRSAPRLSTDRTEVLFPDIVVARADDLIAVAVGAEIAGAAERVAPDAVVGGVDDEVVVVVAGKAGRKLDRVDLWSRRRGESIVERVEMRETEQSSVFESFEVQAASLAAPLTAIEGTGAHRHDAVPEQEITAAMPHRRDAERGRGADSKSERSPVSPQL